MRAGALLEHILELTPAASVATSIATSRAWAAASTSDTVWRGKCERLWADKVHVPERFHAGAGLSRLAAYWGSIEDSKRCAITPEELCSMRWSSRMKGWAGESWTADDPWWKGQPAAERQYHADGTTSGGGRGDGIWRFVPESCGREGPLGSFVRHGRNGREFPTHFVSRHAPNWGWVMQNCWGFSASFPLPPRGVAPELEDESELVQSVSVETCHKEASRFNMGLPLPYENGRDEDGDPVCPIWGEAPLTGRAITCSLLHPALQLTRSPCPHPGTGRPDV